MYGVVLATVLINAVVCDDLLAVVVVSGGAPWGVVLRFWVDLQAWRQDPHSAVPHGPVQERVVLASGLRTVDKCKLHTCKYGN